MIRALRILLSDALYRLSEAVCPSHRLPPMKPTALLAMTAWAPAVPNPPPPEPLTPIVMTGIDGQRRIYMVPARSVQYIVKVEGDMLGKPSEEGE